MKWKAIIENDWAFLGPSLRVAKRDADKMAIATNITFETLEPGQSGPQAPLITGQDTIAFMQAMMDAAYDFGLRPSKAQDERHLKEHLEDMREIVKHTLKMNK